MPTTRPRTVADFVAHRARTAPDRLALAVGADGRALTNGDVGSRVVAWTAALRGGDAVWERRVGLAVDDPLEFAAAYLSLLAAGVAVVPLNPAAAAAERWRQADLLDVDLLVSDLPDMAPGGDRPLWRLQDGVPAASAFAARPRSRPAAPAVLLASSGTTGTPKIVPLAERQLLSVAGRIARHHRLGPDERGYSPLPLFHVNAQVVGLLAALVSGAGLVIDRRFHRTDFWALLDDWRVTWLNAVPAVLAILAEAPAPDETTATRLRFARSASAPLPPAVQVRFQERSGVSVLETYGMTEAASQIAANPLDEMGRQPGSAGLPVGVELRVVDGDGRPCRPGEDGAVEIRGPDVVRHYLRPDGQPRPARSADGWLVTGDVGHLDERGFVFLTGRADDVINCGGEKIYPREIEDVLRTHPAVTQAVVVGRRDDVLGECPVAYVTTRDGTVAGALAVALMQRCEAHLGRSRRPRRLVVVDRVPTGPTGKVSRRLLQRDTAGLRDLAAVEQTRAS
ncbi:MAG TPA: AMP-binding protein [Candidatus Dormibacteraeota bacterium]|nr:AMP-binding protein [Candidatus Dormibacteraeota bacterium]